MVYKEDLAEPWGSFGAGVPLQRFPRLRQRGSAFVPFHSSSVSGEAESNSIRESLGCESGNTSAAGGTSLAHWSHWGIDQSTLVLLALCISNVAVMELQ